MSIEEDNIFLNNSTDISKKSVLLKRARAKYFTYGLMFKMIELDSKLKKGYWNTYYCATVLKQEEKEIKSKYCKNRWCLVCNRIRTAINYKKYSDEINSWGPDRYFLTLTIPNVKADNLKTTIDSMINNFQRIIEVFRKRKIKLIGIRKIECTYNFERDDYHPHFHLIIKGKNEAELLKTEWLKRYLLAENYCQDIRQADEKSVMELFKYFTKLITSKHDKNNYNGKKSPIEYRRKIYVEALDIVFLAIKNKRTFQNFGFKAKIIDEIKEETVEVNEICDKIQYWEWKKELSDWINIDSGELLTGYKPSNAIKELLEGIERTLERHCKDVI